MPDFDYSSLDDLEEEGGLQELRERAEEHGRMGWERGKDGKWSQTGAPMLDQNVRRMTDMNGEYWGEDIEAERRGKLGKDDQESLVKELNKQFPDKNLKPGDLGERQFTKYFNEEEGRKLEVGVTKDGLMKDGSGKLLDTTANKEDSF